MYNSRSITINFRPGLGLLTDKNFDTAAAVGNVPEREGGFESIRWDINKLGANWDNYLPFEPPIITALPSPHSCRLGPWERFIIWQQCSISTCVRGVSCVLVVLYLPIDNNKHSNGIRWLLMALFTWHAYVLVLCLFVSEMTTRREIYFGLTIEFCLWHF